MISWIILAIFISTGLWLSLSKLFKKTYETCYSLKVVRVLWENIFERFDRTAEKSLVFGIWYVILFGIFSFIVYFFNGLSLNQSLVISLSDFVTGYIYNDIKIKLMGKSGDVIRHWSFFHQLFSYTVLISTGVNYVSYYFVNMSGDIRAIRGNGSNGGGGGGGGGSNNGSHSDVNSSSDEKMNEIERDFESAQRMEDTIKKIKISSTDKLEGIKNKIIRDILEITLLPTMRGFEYELEVLREIIIEINQEKPIPLDILSGTRFEGLRKIFDDRKISRLAELIQRYNRFRKIKQRISSLP